MRNKAWHTGLSRSRKGFLSRLSDIFKGKPSIDEETFDELEALLIESDLGVEITTRLLEELRSHQNTEDFLNVFEYLRKRLLEMLSGMKENAPIHGGRPHVILVVGVNGSGKTTTVGKLAHRYRSQGKKVLLAGSDTFRAAAGEQLEEWAQRSATDVIRQCMGADSAAVAFDALNAAHSRGVDVLIIDTAGRLHNRANLMEELKKIPRVLKKKMDTAPHEVLLVLDATTGQNGLNQARIFTEAVGVTGLVLTKMDGTARGGIVVSIQQTLGIPVCWVGIGEGRDDLLPFDAGAFIDGWFGRDDEIAAG
ncbi:MAG TPA: signal recognition particle-docking protein FtsY [bacterium]|nr:signal recognition particle-docking protein FtsY [bacterium]